MEKLEITKEGFQAYEGIRESGIVNMMMVNSVCDMSGLEREQVLYIMKNYGSLKDQFAQ